MKFTLEELRSNVRTSIQRSIANTKSLGVDGTVDDPDAFHDAIQTLITTARPTINSAVIEFCLRLIAAAKAADDDGVSWKVLVLSLIRRRYHVKSPEAKRIGKANAKDEKSDTSSTDINGDGERLMFYLAVICLREFGRSDDSNGDEITHDDATSTSAKNAKRDKPSSTKYEYSSKASAALLRMAFLAGGTRDKCALIELLMFDLLVNGSFVRLKGQEKISRSDALQAVASSGMFVGPLSDGPLDEILSSAANMLDFDLALIRSGSSRVDDRGVPVLPSTINTFLPHRDRGSGSSNNARNIVQTVAELCIWTRTSVAMSSPRFVEALNALKSECAKEERAENDKRFMECIHNMQTCIRRFRQELNAAARSKGFSLCSSFLMDPTTLNLSMIRRGKEGDITALKNLAAKKSDSRVLTLVAKRQEDPSKATPIESVVWLARNWVHMPKEGEDIDEIRELELAIQNAAVRATIERIKSKVGKAKDGSSSKVILASLDGTSVNDASAVLVAAAMSSTFSFGDQSIDKMEPVAVSSSPSMAKLFINADEYNLETLADVIGKLDQIFKKETTETASSTTRGENGGIPASTKDVQNLIERHVKPGDRLLIFTSTDLKLEQRLLEKLKAENSSIHVHIGDEWSARMEREGAKLGDITVTLMWDDLSDLDLHAICPDGFEISYSFKYWRKGEGAQVQGNLDVDMNGGGGESSEPVENIFFGDLEKDIEAPSGKYKIFVQNYAYRGNKIPRGDPVPWRVRVTINGESKEYDGVCTGSGSSSDVTVCEFEYNGRTAPLPESVGTAMGASNLVSVTSSTGTTLDSLCQLASVFEEHVVLDRVRQLQQEDESADGGSALMAPRGSFHITNRELMYLNLSRLPSCFREEVGKTFGGPSLTKLGAASVAKRLVDENIPIQELERAGYPKVVVESVREEMQTFGV
mmetsp:Transcript_4005/g.7642  ORF Transcript_4005/g.7642 Transcript_4005/m.7642 type:complete len:929 (-) Transcript_4005:155-2941(-)